MNDYHKIAEALNYISKHRLDQPDLDELATHVNTSPYHFQRMFTDWAGVSPKKFLQYLTLQHARYLLNKPGNTLTDTAYETGLSGTGRLHDLFVSIECMTPGEYKNGGKNLEIQYSLQESMFGRYLVASTKRGVCNLLFYNDQAGEAENELHAQWPNAKIHQQENKFHTPIRNFFHREAIFSESIKLHLKSTPFQLKVWEALLKIPEGQLNSYGDIAQYIGNPSAQRAVGTAIGSNPVGYIIPCHRVIKSVGSIGEYRWGTERKMAMAGWEAAKT